MSELVLLLSADIDIQQAYQYYEDYQEGRGALFLGISMPPLPISGIFRKWRQVFTVITGVN